MSTKIEWCEETWNALAGCTKISPGCDNCFAEPMARRLAHMPHTKDKYKTLTTDGKWNGNISIEMRELQKPYSWKKPRMIFVGSMGDVFHKNTPYEWQDAVFKVMEENPHHTFLLLTKRADLMADFSIRYGVGCFPKNIWWGVTVEDQKRADERIPYLLTIDAPVRFLSIEPILGAIDLTKYLPVRFANKIVHHEYGSVNWIITGGESGHKARHANPLWIESLKDQAQEAGVPFFFKQWGEWVREDQMPTDEFIRLLNTDIFKHPEHHNFDGDETFHYYRLGKKKTGSRLDNMEYKEYPKL